MKNFLIDMLVTGVLVLAAFALQPTVEMGFSVLYVTQLAILAAGLYVAISLVENFYQQELERVKMGRTLI